jgi:hypothetical protein
VLIDPATKDWTACDDSTVWHAAQDGVPQAKAELRKREMRQRANPHAVAAAVARAKR